MDRSYPGYAAGVDGRPSRGRAGLGRKRRSDEDVSIRSDEAENQALKRIEQGERLVRAGEPWVDRREYHSVPAHGATARREHVEWPLRGAPEGNGEYESIGRSMHGERGPIALPGLAPDVFHHGPDSQEPSTGDKTAEWLGQPGRRVKEASHHRAAAYPSGAMDAEVVNGEVGQQVADDAGAVRGRVAHKAAEDLG